VSLWPLLLALCVGTLLGYLSGRLHAVLRDRQGTPTQPQADPEPPASHHLTDDELAKLAAQRRRARRGVG